MMDAPYHRLSRHTILSELKDYAPALRVLRALDLLLEDGLAEERKEVSGPVYQLTNLMVREANAEIEARRLPKVPGKVRRGRPPKADRAPKPKSAKQRVAEINAGTEALLASRIVDLLKIAAPRTLTQDKIIRTLNKHGTDRTIRLTLTQLVQKQEVLRIPRENADPVYDLAD